VQYRAERRKIDRGKRNKSREERQIEEREVGRGEKGRSKGERQIEGRKAGREKRKIAEYLRRGKLN
jgi:hypothetical protein